MFAAHWLTSTFEVEVMTQWHKLSAEGCRNLDEYTTKFWNALLLVDSYRTVFLKEQVDKYCCGLSLELRDYCTKTMVANMSQLIEVANTAYQLMQGKVSGFKGSNGQRGI